MKKMTIKYSYPEFFLSNERMEYLSNFNFFNEYYRK